MKKSKQREKELESYMRRRVEKAGGLFFKWVSPGNDGVPDRIVLHRGNVFFVELKAPNGSLRPSQRIQFPRFEKQGFFVYILSSRPEINAWLEEWIV